MPGSDPPGPGAGPAHRRRRRSKGSDDRLRALGERIPVIVDAPVDRSRVARVVGYVVVLVVLGLLAAAGVQWFRPIPSPAFRSTVSAVHLPGSPPSLPWPGTGAAALSLEGVGSLGHAGSAAPLPVAGLTKVMTAYVVLHDHPLAPGDAGPAIPVTAPTIAAAQAEAATQQSMVPVAAGESLTELQALEGVLVAQGNDLATLLAVWDAGSTAAFVAKMNDEAHVLGLGSTRFADVSGFDPGSVSTPADLVRLGEAAMAIPVFRDIVALGQVTLPLTGVIYNFDYALGRDGIVGIKTGADGPAGGCFLFEAQQTVGGQSVTLVGAVLGQRGASPLTTALDGAEALVTSAFAGVETRPLLAVGQRVGEVVTPWGASAPVTASASASVIGWPALTVPVHPRVGALPSAMPADTRIGVLRVDLGGRTVDVPVHTTRSLQGPSALWRLTRW